MNVYFDNSATTRAYDEVVQIMVKTLQNDYGNPSSMHIKGLMAENYIKDSRQVVADSLKVQPKEIYFTSGGTEANNIAILGGARAMNRIGNHVITTKIEHPSVYEPMKALEKEGFVVDYLSVDKNGLVDLEELENLVNENTVLVSTMYVNNEIGAVQAVEAISKIVKEKNRRALYHVDGIQAYGKYIIRPNQMGIDLLSVSGHKIHGPKGVGAIYIKDRVNVKPIVFGGGQEKEIRQGTENVSGIAGFGMAAKIIYTQLADKVLVLYEIRKYFIDEIMKIDDVVINGLTDDRNAPHIVSVSFMDIRSEVLLHALEEKGVYVSSGSACASNKPQVSKTLKAIGVDDKLLDSTIRFSFSFETTKEEINYCIRELKEIVPSLRRFVRK